MRRIAIGLALFQVADAVGNEIPRRLVRAHLDHLGVPEWLRPLLPLIKVSTAAGLLIGLRRPEIGSATAASLAGYYASAATFHHLSGDHVLLSLPAAACSVASAALFASYGRGTSV